MSLIKVFVETGKQRTFTGALDWPGWARGAKEEASALQALLDYGARYARALHTAGIEFHPPASVLDFTVAERVGGDASTDFGAPAAALAADSLPVDQAGLRHFKAILQACWQAFDGAVQAAAGRELQTGPRGGGRDLDRIIDHVIDADLAYLRRLAWKHPRQDGADAALELERMRCAILEALDVAVTQGVPESGPRGGRLWTPRYFVRRSAWHVLDHAWEIEDRVV
jgi:hypothetical protein